MSMLFPAFLGALPATTPKGIANVTAVEKILLTVPQVPIKTLHVLHAGMYSRTIFIPARVMVTGAIVKIPTMLTISGDVLVSFDEDDGIHLIGTHVLPASAGRKQLFATKKETTVTMTFCTLAMTVEQAEAEFTDDTDLLFSRRDPELNTIVITGE